MKTDFLAPQIHHSILLLRGQKVLLSHDLARLYGVETKALNRAVLRNIERFPEDFMFQLTGKEWKSLRCQIGTSIDTESAFPDETASSLRRQIGTSKGRGGSRVPPYAFTEQGVAMLSSVLRSDRAVQVNVAIMRTFVRLRELLYSNADLARKLEAMERKYDGQFKVVFDAIRQLMTPPSTSRREIGFHAIEKEQRHGTVSKKTRQRSDGLLRK